MNWKTWVPLVLAVVLGLFAMKVARDVLSKNNQPVIVKEEGTQVVVLNKDLPGGAQISAADLSTRKMAGDISMDNVVTKTSDVEGRVLATNGIKDSPLLTTMLAPKGAQSGLQAVIPEGMRAITIEINEFTGVAGYLQGGCRVDLVATMTTDGEMISRTVAQNIKVQTVGMRRAADGDQNAPPSIRSVTLLASPKEVETIELAASIGRTRLVLRSTNDTDKPLSEGITVAELRGKSGSSSAEKTHDPFGPLVPVVDPKTPARPTTQQTAAFPAVPQRPRNQRVVLAIRNGKEETIVLDLPDTTELAQPTEQPQQKQQAKTQSEEHAAAGVDFEDGFENDGFDNDARENQGFDSDNAVTDVDTEELSANDDESDEIAAIDDQSEADADNEDAQADNVADVDSEDSQIDNIAEADTDEIAGLDQDAQTSGLENETADEFGRADEDAADGLTNVDTDEVSAGVDNFNK